MAVRLTATVSSHALRLTLLHCRGVLFVQPHRNRYTRGAKGKSPQLARTFQQRLDELNFKDPELDRVVNIGFPLEPSDKPEDDKKAKQRLWLKSKDKLEYAARQRTLQLDLGEVKEAWLKEQGPAHIRQVVEHYGVFAHLFGSAFFYNTTPMSVCYDYDDELVTPVYYGNHIPPSEAAVPPVVSYPSDEGDVWTLVMTSPDGNLQHNDQECLHWMVSNIPGSDVERGETLCDYLQPIPVRGVGHLRYVFVLYKHSKRLDLAGFRRPSNCSLAERSFSTLDFYREHQDDLTPACVCFFQSQWDQSVRTVFHDVLKMSEPSYEFIRVANYHPAQRRYPHKQPFNLYLDRYRDVKDIQEEVLKERLKRVDPLTPPSPSPRFPNLMPLPPSVPSWLKLKLRHIRLGKHQWKDMNP